jgi:hypothetical protein
MRIELATLCVANPRGMTMKASMAAQELGALGERPGRMKPESVAIAREVLVDGISHVEAAKRHGLTKQRVGAMVERVLAAARDVPWNWERVEVWLPPELAQQVRAMEAPSARAGQGRGGLALKRLATGAGPAGKGQRFGAPQRHVILV